MRKLKQISFGLFLIFLIMGCRSLSRDFDFEKQEAFEAQFSEGMSQVEVEEKLGEISDYAFINERVIVDGDIMREYHTESKSWGSPTYYFRFTPDDRLVTLFPVSP